MIVKNWVPRPFGPGMVAEEIVEPEGECRSCGTDTYVPDEVDASRDTPVEEQCPECSGWCCTACLHECELCGKLGCLRCVADLGHSTRAHRACWERNDEAPEAGA